MRKLYIFFSVILLILMNLSIGFSSDQKIIKINREVTAKVSEAGQKYQLIVPVDPLEFDTTLDWDLSLNKKSLASEKEAAYLLFELIGSVVKQTARYSATDSGRLIVPRGAQYKITLSAGEYSRLLSTTGAELNLKVSYSEILIKYAQADRAYQFKFEVEGPAGFKDWKWHWTNKQTDTGNKVAHQFNEEGNKLIVLQANGKTPSGRVSEQYQFELEVPPLIQLSPKVEPLTGPAELKVATQANVVVNYGRQAQIFWSFEGEAPSDGLTANHIYKKPGKYFLVLTAKVDDYTYQRSWVVEVTPLLIRSNPVLTPLTGPVPLEVTGTTNPVITGGPTQLLYTWNIAGDKLEATGFKQTFTEPGEYQVVLTAQDKLHPDLVIPTEVFIVKALPPQLNLKPTVSAVQGLMPLAVEFNPNLEVKGGPVELEYRWEFGDGAISNQDKPTHTFKQAGEYVVRLLVTDRKHSGNMAQTSLNVKVLPPQLQLTASANLSSGLVPCKVNFYSQLAIAGSPCEPLYYWEFGDGSFSLEPNPVHTYLSEGNYTVKLVVKDRLNPLNSVSASVQVEVKLPKLRLTAAVTPTSGNAPLTVQCRAWAEKEGTANPKLKYTWDFGDGTQALGMEQTHTFTKPGTYVVLVYVEDEALKLTERKTFKVTVK